jgi:hypothetical protein
MIVYKVVETHGTDRNYSCVICEAGWRREYIVGQPTYPIPGSALMAFDSLKAAESFRFLNKTQAIYLAEAKKSRRHRAALIHWGWIEEDVLQTFWKYRKVARSASDMVVPPGTVFCDEITLLERVA